MGLRGRVMGVTAIVLALVASSGVGQQPSPVAGLDSSIRQAMAEWKVPGLAIAIVKNDTIVMAKGFGVRELGKSDPVDSLTIFAIGSATKAFTASAIGMLVDEGKLSLDGRVTAYLPSFQLWDPYATREVTVRDLLTHRTGVSGGDLLWASGGLTRDEIVSRLRLIPPTWGFRSRWDYSNVMLVVAGQVLAAAAGSTWDDFVRNRILEPLGMTNTTTTIRDLSRFSDVATPHDPTNGAPRPIAWRNMDNTVAGGGINSNARDMAEWLRFHLNDGVREGRRLLSSAFIREMQTPQMIIRREGPWAEMTPDANFMAYGLGWFVSDRHGRKILQHGGGIDGMSAMVGLIPEERVGIAVMSNLNGNQLPGALMWRVFDSYLGAPARDWSHEAAESARRANAASEEQTRQLLARVVPNTKPALEPAQYAGRYHNDVYGDATVRFENGKLFLRFGKEFDGVLEHLQYDAFRARWNNPARGADFVNFTIDATRQAASLDIYMWVTATFKRAEASNAQ